MNTVFFTFSDLVHFDRNEPGQPQSIYYDVDAEFVQQLTDCIMAYEQDCKGKDMLMVDFLSGMSARIESEIGPMTIPQILTTVHGIACKLGLTEGIDRGYQAAYSAMASELTRGFLASQSGKQATA
jgi:hypothetical protein